MAKEKKTILTKRKVLAEVERALKDQEKLVLELKELKRDIQKIGVLGFGAAKKGRKKDAKPIAAK